MLRSLGHPIEQADSDPAAVRRVERGGIDVLLAGVDPTQPDSLELLSYVRRKHPGLPVLVLLDSAHHEREREAFKLGATAILRYPLPAGELRAAVLQAVESRVIAAKPDTTPPQLAGPTHQSISSHQNSSSTVPSHSNGHAMHSLNPTAGASRNSFLRTTPSAPSIQASNSSDSARIKADSTPSSNGPSHSSSSSSSHHAPIQTQKPPTQVGQPAVVTPFDDNPFAETSDRPTLLGNSPPVRQAVEMAITLATTTTPALIVGDQGTGKSLLARLIHKNSPRSEGAFVEVVCGGLDEAILERELFGQRVQSGETLIDRPGKIERAKGGSLFLDEVAALSPGLQLQLLRLLQDGEFEPQGSREAVQVDIRVILATQENLPMLVEQGKFRRDLYDQISVVCLKLPPLRERGLDIERLAEHFLKRFAGEFAKPIGGFAADAIEALSRHEWAGNVRELESVIQRGVALCHGPKISAANLALGYSHGRVNVRLSGRFGHLPFRIRPLKEALEEPEKQIIIQALQALNWNRQETARMLDINRTTLYKKMKKYGLLMDEPAMMN